ncbi:MAG: RNase adapter RapZ [Demequinaceae bacterium]|nr:RNase adapter RapZ [Demequinaceae bacterium]
MNDEAPADTYPSGLPRTPIPRMEKAPEVIVVTGMSGAGRSKAADVLGDLGWYVVDNLPPSMLSEVVGVVAREGHGRLAAVADVRGGRLFSDLKAVLDDLVQAGMHPRVIFLDATDEALVRRFELIRRPNLLQGDGTLLDGIRRERALLEEARSLADIVIDTSETSVREFAERLIAEVGVGREAELVVNVVSFGFKNGVPVDADFVADVRFLDNPHWIPELRPLTGLDERVRNHVLASEGAEEFLDAFVSLLRVALSRFQAHDKHFVAVAIGCTGGRHRSVAIVEEVVKRLKDMGLVVRTSHRDMARDT